MNDAGAVSSRARCAACGAEWRIEDALILSDGRTWLATCPASELEVSALGGSYCAQQFRETLRAVRPDAELVPMALSDWRRRFGRAAVDG